MGGMFGFYVKCIFRNAPPLETGLRPDVYVFTPIDAETLVRARILDYDSEKERALVRLIDHGDIAWRDKNALFEMEFEKRQYPWQASPIILQGVEPENEVSYPASSTFAYLYIHCFPGILDT